jgi:hypothetical protein
MDDISKQIGEMIKGFNEESKMIFCHAILIAAQTKHTGPCWCKSGKSFRECHLDREGKRKISEGELRQKLSSIFDSKKYCCASFDSKNCDLPIKGAHTVQRGRVLSSFCKYGHVGTFYRNTNGFENIRDIKSGVKRQASIFYGFCSYHDTELFKNIENIEFSISYENCWASSYRAVCHEFYQKNAAKEAVEWKINNLDLGYKLSDQIILQESLCFLKRDIDKGFSDIDSIKEKYEKLYTNNKFDLLSSYIIELDAPISVAVCASISPYYKVDGIKFQNLGDPLYKFQHFSISTATINGNVVYVISHLKEHKVISEYLLDVFTRDKSFIKDWLFKSIFAYAENVFFDLDWWESLNPDSKDAIYSLAMTENYTKPFEIDGEVSKDVTGSICSVTHI